VAALNHPNIPAANCHENFKATLCQAHPLAGFGDSLFFNHGSPRATRDQGCTAEMEASPFRTGFG